MKPTYTLLILISIFLSACQPAPAPIPQATPPAETAAPTLVEAASGPHGDSYAPAISGDGQVISFTSRNTGLASPSLASCPGPDGIPINCAGVYVYDRTSQAISLVSVSSAGEPANGNCFASDLSNDGRFVVFACAAGNLAEGKTDQDPGVFVHDRQTGETRLVAASGTDAHISGDGRFVSYNQLVEHWEVFVHDGQTGNTVQVGLGADYSRPAGDSLSPRISFDGRWLAFWSWNGNLVKEDLEGCGQANAMYSCGDIFLYNGENGDIKRVKVSRAGGLGQGPLPLSLTGDARLLAFDNMVYDTISGLKTPLCPDCSGLVISPNGRWVVYPDAGNIFTIDRSNGKQTQVNLSPQGEPGDGGALVYKAVSEGDVFVPGLDLSNDAGLVVFSSADGNLAAGDTARCSDGFFADHNCLDIFLYDRMNNTLNWISKP